MIESLPLRTSRSMNRIYELTVWGSQHLGNCELSLFDTPGILTLYPVGVICSSAAARLLQKFTAVNVLALSPSS